MTAPINPRQALRELTLAVAALQPYARQGAGASLEAASVLAEAKQALDRARQLDALPWAPVLEASLQHLTPFERDALETGHSPDPFVTCMHNDHAHVLFVANPALEPPPALGPGLSALYALAIDGGFRYVRVDEDCAVVPSLEVLS